MYQNVCIYIRIYNHYYIPPGKAEKKLKSAVKAHFVAPFYFVPRDFPPLGKLNLPFRDSTTQTRSWSLI